MALKVFKYQIPVDNYCEIQMPIGAKILSVDMQHGGPCMWALCDPEKVYVSRKFRFAGTGHPIDEPIGQLEFIGTFQMDGGNLIFHIFEVKGES